jgi:hypothetical protein
MVEQLTLNVVGDLQDTTELVSDDDPLGPDGLTVAYVLTRCVERGVSLDRVTVVPMPYKDCDNPGLRPRITKPILATTSVVRQLSPLGWLSLGKQTRRHEKRGWLRTLMQHEGVLQDNPIALWSRVISDHKSVLAVIEGMKIAMGSNFCDPREHIGVQGKGSGGKFVCVAKVTQVGVPKNEYTIPYLLHAYDVTRTTFQRRLKQDYMGKVSERDKQPYVYKGLTCIDNRQLARAKYTARFFYARTHAMSAEPPPTVPPMWEKFSVRYEYYGRDYDKAVLQNDNMTYWERMAREHDARQPFIEHEVISVIKASPVTSYRDVATKINGWCSGQQRTVAYCTTSLHP